MTTDLDEQVIDFILRVTGAMGLKLEVTSRKPRTISA